jgi:AcrR family transcriptional regulator
MLSSAIAVVSEHGYGEMSVARVATGAGVSRRTFYDLFEDREDCFLAAFDETVARARMLVLEGYASEHAWEARVRAALLAFLSFLDREPELRSLLVVDALRAGPRVQGRRAEVLAELSMALHQTGLEARGELGVLPELTGEGVTGAVLGVIHTRLSSGRPGRTLTLLNPLMGVILLPYLGSEAAQRELAHPEPNSRRSGSQGTEQEAALRAPLAGLPMRVTYRTLLVLSAVAGAPGASNREVADRAGVTDQGQISKLLARLQGIGLVENTSPGQPSGAANQWQLTPRGLKVEQALNTASNQPREQTHVL